MTLKHKLIKKQFKILDYGIVELIDFMGDDSRIVQSARVSYGKNVKTIHQDRELIRYLMRHQHMSPFEMNIVTFYMKLPIFVARQLIRHRTASVNEISGRYSVLKDEYYKPEEWRFQDRNNKQGSKVRSVQESQRFLENRCYNYPHRADEEYRDICRESFDTYNGLLEYDIGREMARMCLPVSTYTEWYWTCDLRNILHMLQLRLDSHAQWEIQQYAKVISNIVKELFPMTYEAFEDYQLYSINFSVSELIILNRYTSISDILFYLKSLEDGIYSKSTLFIKEALSDKLERKEFKEKLLTITLNK